MLSSKIILTSVNTNFMEVWNEKEENLVFEIL
jgi:hypothetical protein